MYGGASMQAAAPYANYGAMLAPEQGFEGPAYGGFPGKSPFARRQRPTNVMSLAACILVPIMIFAAVYSLQSFSLHYTDNATEKILCWALLGFVLLLGYVAVGAWRRRDEGTQDPKWYTFVFVTAAIAWTFAYIFGNTNFLTNIQPYMDIMNLNIYYAVNPSTHSGQQLMDAGRVQFIPGTRLETSRSMGFKNLDTYCVAPITFGASPNTTNGEFPVFDFWAIGLNCCSGHLPDFACGEYANPNARFGLRLMKDDQRAFFRLAVQQAEASYNIRAEHPVFMYWMSDPMPEIMAYQDSGYKFWLIGIGAYAAFQIVLAIVATIIFAKAGL